MLDEIIANTDASVITNAFLRTLTQLSPELSQGEVDLARTRAQLSDRVPSNNCRGARHLVLTMGRETTNPTSVFREKSEIQKIVWKT